MPSRPSSPLHALTPDSLGDSLTSPHVPSLSTEVNQQDGADVACVLMTTFAWYHVALPIVEHAGPAILQFLIHWLGSRTPAARIKALFEQLDEKERCLDSLARDNHDNGWTRMRTGTVAFIGELQDIRDGSWLRWGWSCVPCTHVSKRFTDVYDRLKRFRVLPHEAQRSTSAQI